MPTTTLVGPVERSDAGGDGGTDGGTDAGVAPAPTVRFEDVTDSAGVSYSQFASFCASPCTTEIRLCEVPAMTGGVAVGDFDDDGWPDVYVTRMDGADALFRNLGDGRFEDVAAAVGLTDVVSSNGAAFGDFDADGDLDLVVGGVNTERLRYYEQQPGGQFVESGRARGLALEDGELHTLMSLVVADYDGDGYLDLYTTAWRPRIYHDGLAPRSHARLLHNRGPAAPGHFEDVTLAGGLDLEGLDPAGTWSFSARFVDLDGDGALDLPVAVDFGYGRLFYGDGPGHFADATLTSGFGLADNAMGLSVADFDGDGAFDVFVTSIFDDRPMIEGYWGRGGNKLYRAVGARDFEEVAEAAGVAATGWGWGVASEDFDADGDVDLVVTSGQRFCAVSTPFETGGVSYFQNTGSARFTDQSARAGFAYRGTFRAVATLDYDRDHRPDLFVVRHAGQPLLLRNTGEGAGHGLAARAAPGVPAALAAGVQFSLIVREGGPVQRRLPGGPGLLSQSEPVAYFGLGDATSAARLLAHWPDGRTTELVDLPADSTVEVSPP